MPRLTPPVRLLPEHDLQPFRCGAEALDRWLIRQARRNEGPASRTYVICDGQQVVGYYCLATGAVERRQAPGRLARNMPQPIPVLVIGRLAVDRSYQGLGIGAGLLKDALTRCETVHREVGSRAVIVHALDDSAKAFYARWGFRCFPDEPLTLYLPLPLAGRE